MQTIQKIISVSIPYQFSPDKSINDSQILLFDIETTGLSPDISSIYLIGCCYYQKNTWNLIQFFADDYISEQSILEHFADFAKNFKIMIHYNGNGFDIPYLQKKFSHYNMNFSFDTFLQIDLYKKIYPYKKFINIENLKQKTVEQFLGLTRKDSYSGKELIDVYVNYMKDKFGHKPEMQGEQEKLLLHNEEDVTNLIQLTAIMAYSEIFEETPKSLTAVYENSCLEISFTLRNPIGRTIQWQLPSISFFASNKNVMLSVKCVEGELKYFYPNYKDYYYLPAEDVAMHKSVAGFVDKEYRVKAKAATCYTRKQSIFVPQFHGSLEPAFRTNYKEKQSYLELTDKFLSDQDTINNYTSILLQHFIHAIGK